MTEVVSHISDTARWVAVYRAVESRRADALFVDPFAERLAGDSGRAIATALLKRSMSWPMVVRTRLIDDLVMRSVAEGCDRVLNLAAGLDARPYRLDLPRELVWVEADLPTMIDEKERLLANEKPKCMLSREKVNLADVAQRDNFLTRALAGARKTLVITEGLLVYLTPPTVSHLGRDLYGRKNVTWWMVDLASPGVLKMLQKRVNHRLGSDAQLQFGPPEGVRFFAPLGWKPREVENMFRWAAKWRRLPWFLQLVSPIVPDPPAEDPGDKMFSAVVRFERG